MAATISTYLNILKTRYYDRMRSAVFSGHVLLTELRKRSPGGNERLGVLPGLKAKSVRLPRNRGWGREISFDIHTGPNFGIGARAAHHSATTGYMPTPGNQSFVEGKLLSKHYYGTAEIDGSLIDASDGDEAAAMRALDSEMKFMPDQIRSQINIDLYGDGTGKLADVTASSSGTTITVDSTHKFIEGQPIVIAAADGTGAVERTITAINAASKQITVNSATSVTAASDIFRAGVHNTNVSSEYGNACAGMQQIVSDTFDYAGLDRSELEYVRTRAGMYSVNKTDYDPALFEDVFFDAKKRGNGKPSLIICDHNFYKYTGELLYPQGRWQLNQKTFSIGYPTLYVHDVPMVRDPACPPWMALVLDLDSFELGIERELSLVSEDKAEMVRKAGPNGEMCDAYQFAFCTRLNLLCNNPAANSKIIINPAA